LICGNVQPEINDARLFIREMNRIAGNEPVSSFDFNGNGRTDTINRFFSLTNSDLPGQGKVSVRAGKKFPPFSSLVDSG